MQDLPSSLATQLQEEVLQRAHADRVAQRRTGAPQSFGSAQGIVDIHNKRYYVTALFAQGT